MTSRRNMSNLVQCSSLKEDAHQCFSMAFKYALVLFVSDLSNKKEIDIVPSSWLDHYKEYGGTGCKYMPASLLKSAKCCKLLQMMVKHCEEPDPTWPTFPVQIRGTAETIEEAEEKLLRLEKEPYAFSTDTEQSAKAKAAAVEKTFKLKALAKDQLKIDNMFRQTALELTDEPIEIAEPKKLKSQRKGNQKIVKKPISLKKNSLNWSSTSIASTSSSSPPSSLCKPMKINNETKKKRINDSTNYIVASKKRKKNSSQSRPLTPLSSSSSQSPSPSTKSKKIRNINSNLRDINMKMEIAHEDSTLATIADNPFHHYNKSETEAELNISSSINNTVSNDFLLECINHNYNSLSKQLANLKGQIVSISADVARVLSEIKKNNSSHLLESSLLTDPEGNPEVKKLEFPLSTIEDFDKFNEKLKDEKYKNKINKRIYFSLDGKNSITRNMGNIIRAYISRDVALSYVAVKATPKKKVFKDTTFFTSIKAAIRQKFEKNQESISDNKFHHALSAVLNNAKDWDGYRVSRIRKQLSNEDKKN